MSLGNTYDNNKRTSGVFDPTVYSPYKMNNAEGIVDKTCISFAYWNNSLKISISPKKNTADGQVAFDYENGISIYLNHTKAHILAEEIKRFLADPVKYDNCGVPSGQGLITVSRGTEFNSPAPLIIIRKISETGAVVASFAYQTKADYFFAVRNYSETGGFDKETADYTNIELEQMVVVLEEFYKAVTCATAYTVLDQLKFEHNRQREWRNSVSAKLGIELPGSRSNEGRSFSSTSYFSNASGRSSSPIASGNEGYTRATLDDID